MKYTKSNIINGAIIYATGDTIAAILLNEFLWSRLFGMMLIGATFYALEIPNYFKWIDKKTENSIGIKQTLSKTILAIAYFNPLWIARHLFFIKLFSLNFENIQLDLFTIALWSFIINIPISFIANYIIQNKIKLHWRFLASAIFSAIMAIYYAMSETFFS
ncbi:MAG: hypothetical protein IMY67_12415 [Bacteroidetes bacterium]|nr:hypothetical protein [Bacteroidota bacterium]